MFDDDPFKNTPESKSEKTKTTKEDSVTEETEITAGGKITTTYKFGAGYDAPWVVTYADTPAEARKLANSSAFKAHLNETFEMWVNFRKEVEKQGLGAPQRPAGGSGGSGGGQARPKRPNPPGTPEIECEGGHGVRNYFNSPKGWEALFCAAEEKSDQCEPLFKDKKTGEFKANK